MDKKRILIVDLDNTCLSPMIAALLARALYALGMTRFYSVESAGLNIDAKSKNPATERTIEIIREENISIADHRSHYINDVDSGRYCRAFTTNQEDHARLQQRFGFKDITVLLLESGGGIHLSPTADTHEYKQCIALLKSEMRRIAQEIAREHRKEQSEEASRRGVALEITRPSSALSE